MGFKEDSRKSKTELLEEYIRFGGFPIIALGEYEPQQAYQIVNGIYYTVVSRDIVKRHRINKQDLFDRVVKYIIENVGKTFSANSISNFLKSEHRKVSVEVFIIIYGGWNRHLSYILVHVMICREKIF